jgi:hypothetical protein
MVYTVNGYFLRYFISITNGYVTLEHYSKHPYGSLIRLSKASTIEDSLFMKTFAFNFTFDIDEPILKEPETIESLNLPLTESVSLSPGFLIIVSFVTLSATSPS